MSHLENEMWSWCAYDLALLMMSDLKGWIMMKIDAAIFQKANRIGIGIVVRDHRAEVGH